jgi:hypothetical protein
MYPICDTLSANSRAQAVELLKGHLTSASEGRHALSLHDQIAIWANEGGAGGEVVRSADVAVKTGSAGVRRTA